MLTFDINKNAKVKFLFKQNFKINEYCTNYDFAPLPFSGHRGTPVPKPKLVTARQSDTNETKS